MRIKEVKKMRKNKKRLLALLCIMMLFAFALFIACALKTFFLALISVTQTPVLIGSICSLAALWVTGLLENTIEEVRHGKHTGIRQMEDHRARRAA